MSKSTNSKQNKNYDLEERTYQFAKEIRLFVRNLKKDFGNIEDIKQLIRSSGSVGANYIEANESLSKKDFLMRIKICRKEAKESTYWLRLLDIQETPLDELRNIFCKEFIELTKIFGSIIGKSK